MCLSDLVPHTWRIILKFVTDLETTCLPISRYLGTLQSSYQGKVTYYQQCCDYPAFQKSIASMHFPLSLAIGCSKSFTLYPRQDSF